MRRYAANLWPLFALILSACSLVTDFPKDRLRETEPGDGMDASVRPDGGTRDAGRDGQLADVANGCDLTTHAGCGKDQLCCMVTGSPTCIAVSSGDCSGCGMACQSDSQPFCSDRELGCECQVGTGKGCEAEQTCLKENGVARCVECRTDDDCEGANKHCVENRCRECDRGADLNDARDDKGCSGSTPICGASNTCEACTAAPNNCPSGQTCTPGFGCFGCTRGAPVGANGCSSPTTPICGMTASGQMQCAGCTTNLDCAPLPYCNSRTGACTNVCDPDNTDENDGCIGTASICRATPQGGYECRACEPSDCRGDKPHCATAGASAGQCVSCRNDGDCRSANAPVCDATSAECRARVPADCAGTSKPFLVSGQCVECLAAQDCAGNTNGNVCVSNNCGQCASDAECAGRPSTPVCNTSVAPTRCVAGCNNNGQCALQPGMPFCSSNKVCVACLQDGDCSTAANPSQTPLCIANVCRACTEATPKPAADGRCTPALGGELCTSGGRCAACDPLATPNGCSAPATQCSVVNSQPVCIVPPVPDAGTPDAGPVDAGRPDTGVPDTGVPDSGAVDGGGGGGDASMLDAAP